MKFNEVGFFYFILPPIIFAAGYTLKHQRFVNNLDTIMMLGIVGTLITMILLSAILSFANSYLFFYGYKIMTSEILILVSFFRLIFNLLGFSLMCIRHNCGVEFAA